MFTKILCIYCITLAKIFSTGGFSATLFPPPKNFLCKRLSERLKVEMERTVC